MFPAAPRAECVRHATGGTGQGRGRHHAAVPPSVSASLPETQRTERTADTLDPRQVSGSRRSDEKGQGVMLKQEGVSTDPISPQTLDKQAIPPETAMKNGPHVYTDSLSQVILVPERITLDAHGVQG